jgi:hypothetical protein
MECRFIDGPQCPRQGPSAIRVGAGADAGSGERNCQPARHAPPACRPPLSTAVRIRPSEVWPAGDRVANFTCPARLFWAILFNPPGHSRSIPVTDVQQ